MLAEIEDYITDHTSGEDEYLARLYRATQLHLLRPRMASGPLQGQLLRMIARMLRPRRVLEIGTYSGYSALSLAAGMEDGSELITFEVNDEQEDFTRPWLEHAPYPPAIRFIVGDVFALLPAMQGDFDLAFIDANKREYLRYYELVLPRLRPGGFLLADNTLWDGHVTDPAYNKDPQTRAIREFNDFVAADPRVRQLILPLRDGLSLIEKLP